MALGSREMGFKERQVCLIKWGSDCGSMDQQLVLYLGNRSSWLTWKSNVASKYRAYVLVNTITAFIFKEYVFFLFLCSLFILHFTGIGVIFIIFPAY